MPEPEAIQFALVTINATPVELRQCGRCGALVLDGQAQAHADWHGQLARDVGIAGLGFGIPGVTL